MTNSIGEIKDVDTMLIIGSNTTEQHPVFGAMNVEQWNQFHLRHAEMHLSFIVPEGAAIASAQGTT